MALRFSAPGIIRREKDLSNIIAPAGTSVGVIVGGATKGPANARTLVNTDKDFIEKFGNPQIDWSTDKGIYGALQYLQESNSLYFTRATAGDETYAHAYAPSTLTGLSVSSTTVTAQATSAYASLEANDFDTINDIDTFSDSNTSASLLIAALGPGVYGQNVAIKITNSDSTSAAATSGDVDFQYNYDDAESDGSASSATDALWKKVFKIEVFSRNTSADAFPSDPSETFYGTPGDNLSPDGTQLNIETVVNGNSNFIYVNNNLASDEKPADTGGSTFTLAGGAGRASNAQVTAAQVVNALDYFYDEREKVSFDILIGSFYNTSVINQIAAVCNARKDCIGTVQVGAETDTNVDSIITESDALSFSSPSYVAKYAGWDTLQDTFNDKKVNIPKAIFGAVLMARTDQISFPWFAPAGVNRGILPVLDQNVRFTDSQIGSLADANINTSKFIKGIGHVMFGQRTALRKTSALRDINVRRLLLFLENSIEPSLLTFLFEPNNESTRLRVQTIVEGFLETVDSDGGFGQDSSGNGFKVVVDESNNTSQVIDSGVMKLDIFIVPPRSIRNIVMQFVVTRSGVSLTELNV